MSKFKYISLLIILVSLAIGNEDVDTSNIISLKSALEILAKNNELNFIYRDEVIKNINVVYPFQDQDYRNYLHNILKPCGLDYKEFQQHQIIIFPQKNKESYKFQGGVIDAGSHQALPFANVQVKGSNLGVAADDSGWFLLTVPQSDSLTLRVSCIGYKEEEFIVSSAEIGSPLTLPLKMQSIPIAAINVTGQRTKELKIEKQSGEMSISGDFVNIIPSLGSSDVFRGLQMLPGISGVSDGSSGLGIRGGTPDENLIILDGMPLYHMDHFHGLVNALGNTKLDNVKIYKGGFPAKYGERTSAVLELNGTQNVNTMPTMSLNIDFLTSQYYLQLPIKNRHLIEFSYRQSHPDWMQSNWFREIGNYGKKRNLPVGENITITDNNSLPGFYDVSFKYAFKYGNRNKVSFRYYKNSNKVDVGIDEDEYEVNILNNATNFNGITDITAKENSGGQLGFEHFFSNNHKINMHFSFSEYFSELEQQYPANYDSIFGQISSITFKQNNTIKEYNFKLDHTFLINAKSNWESGLKITRTRLGFRNVTDSILDMKQEKWATIVAAYSQIKFNIYDRIDICNGLRMSYQNLNNVFYLEPRFSMNFDIFKNWTMKAAWGKYHQYLNRISSDNIIAGNSDFWLMSDGKTKPGSAEHYILGLTGKEGKWVLDIEGYVKNMKGQKSFIAYLPTDYNIDASAQLLTDGIGYAHGVESVIYRSGKYFNGWLSYNYGKVIHRFKNINNFNYFSANHDHRHEFKLVTNWQWKNFHFGINWVEATGAPFTEIEGKYYISNIDGQEYVYFKYGKINCSRLPNYRRVDVDISYRMHFWQNSLKVGLSIYNVTDYENVLRRVYYVETVDRVTETDILMLGLTPTFYINLELKK